MIIKDLQSLSLITEAMEILEIVTKNMAPLSIGHGALLRSRLAKIRRIKTVAEKSILLPKIDIEV